MGLFDFLGGGTTAEKAQKLKAKATQKFGDPSTRQQALTNLGKLNSPEAVPVLMQRFTFAVEPQTTDADEKDTVFNFICGLGKDAIPAVAAFLRKSDQASSWALRIFAEVLPEPEVTALIVAELTRLGAEYTRDPEKKEVLLHALEGRVDANIGACALPFLHDMADDVKLCAIKTLASVKHEPAREPILQLLLAEETAKRVQTACLQALVDTGFTVQGYREKVEARLGDAFVLDKAGTVKKRA